MESFGIFSQSLPETDCGFDSHQSHLHNLVAIWLRARESLLAGLPSLGEGTGIVPRRGPLTVTAAWIETGCFNFNRLAR
jgi:hypothetical protein